MKKLLISVFAVAAALFATSCAQDGIDSSAVKGEEAVVTFAVNAPEMATRAFGDGKSAKDLYYAVYNIENQLIEEISLLDTPADGEFDSNLNRNVSIRLANDETYSLIFFAQAPTGGAANIDWATQTMEFNPTKMSEEAYDAFWAYVKPFKVNGAATHNVTLTRPFAQIIFGAGDWDEAVASQMEVKQTQLVVTTPSKMNLVSGLTSEPKAFTYAYAELPSELFPNVNYKHMGMGYLLYGADKGMVDVTFNYKDANGAEHTRNMPAVPVQRNYRTTVYGNLLTSQTDFDVTLDDTFLKDDKYGQIDGVNYIKVDNFEEFAAAFADNQFGIIILNDNIVVNQSLSRAGGDATMTVSADKKLVIDLNGKKMSATSSQTGKNYNMFDVRGNLTIKNGTIEYQHTGDNMGWNNFAEIFYVGFNGTLNLDGVTAKNLGGSDMAYVIDMVNADNISVNVENSLLETPYIPIRVFNNNKTGVHNVTIKNSELKGKYCFWVQFWLADGRDQETLDKTLKLDIYNNQVGANNNNTFTFNNNYDAPVLYGYNEAAYFDQYGQEIVLYTPIEGAEGVALDQDGNYVITADEGMASISALIAADEDGFAGKTILLDTDVDLDLGTYDNGDQISNNPIGRDPETKEVTPFKGTFDGQGHTIANLYQSGWAFDYMWGQYGSIGLFSELEGATIKNVVLDGFEAQIEGGDIAFIAGSATGDCVFENIEIKNGKIGTYNNGMGSIIGWSGAGNYTFKNIKIGSDVVLGGLWGSFDSSVGGIVGQAEPGASYHFEDVEINCRLDVYNDVTAAYKYYLYRMCGMIIGRCEETTTIDGSNYPDLSKYNITCENVIVNYGDWMNYHYCVVSGKTAWRHEPGYDYGGIPADHDHDTCATHHNLLLPFDGLFGGAQYGVRPITEYPGVTVNYPASYTPEN